MKTFIFHFGYFTPGQLERNEQYGWEDEDSIKIIIKAGNKEKAIEWGRVISDKFIKLLYSDENKTWKELKCYEGCEELINKKIEERYEIVNYGEYPNWSTFMPLPYKGW